MGAKDREQGPNRPSRDGPRQRDRKPREPPDFATGEGSGTALDRLRELERFRKRHRPKDGPAA